MKEKQASAELAETTKISAMNRGIKVAIPIVIGYFPVAIAYGVLAKQVGMSLTELTMMSALVYAGASQFMAANMIAVGSTALEIIIASFVLNFRHFILGLSLMNRIRNLTLKFRAPLSLGLTDETFAVGSLHTKEAAEKHGGIFYATLFILAYFSWVVGSLVGGLLGEIIPTQLSQSMGIALYALFIGLLIPSVKKERRLGLIAVIAMLLNLICSQFFSSGWSIVIATMVGGASGIVFLKEDAE